MIVAIKVSQRVALCRHTLLKFAVAPPKKTKKPEAPYASRCNLPAVFDSRDQKRQRPTIEQ